MQKYLIIIIIILLSFIVSCSSMSSLNKIIQSEVLFDGGVSSSGEWEDSLRFKRTSWFHEVQMTNDIFVAELKKDSPFNVWLGTAKRTALQECNQFFVTIYRIHNFRRAAKGMLFRAFDDHKMREVNIVEFKANIQGHPTFSGLNLDMYQVTGFCAASKINEISTRLPAFRAVNIL